MSESKGLQKSGIEHGRGYFEKMGASFVAIGFAIPIYSILLQLPKDEPLTAESAARILRDTSHIGLAQELNLASLGSMVFGLLCLWQAVRGKKFVMPKSTKREKFRDFFILFVSDGWVWGILGPALVYHAFRRNPGEAVASTLAIAVVVAFIVMVFRAFHYTDRKVTLDDCRHDDNAK